MSVSVRGRVLQIKDLPPRPAEFDGLLCLGDVPAGMDEAALRSKLQQFGEIQYCQAPGGAVREHRVKFMAHQAAEQAAAEAPKLAVCKYAFVAYRDYDPYDGRGW